MTDPTIVDDYDPTLTSGAEDDAPDETPDETDLDQEAGSGGDES